MKNAVLRIPVVCPTCGRELLAEFPAVPLADALVTGDSIRLYASCHGQVWQANAVEREQLYQYLEAAKLK